MLILLTKKYLTYYKCNPKDIPPAVFSEQGMAMQLYKQFYLYPEDYLNNLNVKAELVNVKHVKRFSIFVYDEVYSGIHGKEYLRGAKTIVIFNDNSVIHVTETVAEIAHLTNVANNRSY